ncbi:LysR family transcriptional regulator [Nonomuraea antimicrobica]
MPVDLRLMRYVIAVAEAGSFEAAAERLHMTQPPLSRQIRDLERELGVDLFHRRPTRLTEAGRVFVEEARDVLASAEQAVERTRRAAGVDHGAVRVGYTVTTAFDEMPKLFAAMRARHPGIRVEAREAWDAELIAAATDGELDVLLGRHLAVPPTWLSAVLRREEFVVVVGAGHRLAGRDRVSLREFRGETLRFFPAGSRRSITTRCWPGCAARARSSTSGRTRCRACATSTSA